MSVAVSKSTFKAQALELCRRVEATGETLVITHRGKPVLELRPFERRPQELLVGFRGAVLRYDAPTEPVGEDLWDALG